MTNDKNKMRKNMVENAMFFRIFQKLLMIFSVADKENDTLKLRGAVFAS